MLASWKNLLIWIISFCSLFIIFAFLTTTASNRDNDDYQKFVVNNYSKNKEKIDKRKLLFWSSDYCKQACIQWLTFLDVSQVSDLKTIFHLLDHSINATIRVIDKSFSQHCYLKKTCYKNLKVLNDINAYSFGNCPLALRR